MSLEEKLPIANWPEKSGEYKVVQLEIDGSPMLRFQEQYVKTHGLILMVALDKFEIPYAEIEVKSGGTMPNTKGDRYRVLGMGKAKISVEQKQAAFYGNSYDYEMNIDKNHIHSMRSLVGEWKLG